VSSTSVPWIQSNPPPVPLKSPARPHEVRWLEQVAERAITTVYKRIESFKGNSLTAQHRLALRRIIVGYSYLAAGLIDARPAYSLDIGGGKTLSIEAFVEALYHFRDSVPWTAAVATSQVRSLCSMRQSLLDNYGVPLDFTGLWHSYDTNAKAHARLMPSDTVEELAVRRVALVTHARIATPKALHRLNDYWNAAKSRRESRGVLLFDEALYSMSHYAVNLLDFETDVLMLRPQIHKKFGLVGSAENPLHKPQEVTTYTDMLDHLTDCLEVFTKERESLEFGPPQPFTLPVIEPEIREKFSAALDTLTEHVSFTGAAREVLESGYLPAALIKANLGAASISFAAAVPDALKRIAILDASFQIDKLEQQDVTIVCDPLCPKAVKDYHPLSIHALQRGGGKTAVFGNVLGEIESKHEAESIVKAVVEVVVSLPPEESVLLFTFLPKRRKGKLLDVAKILQAALKDAHVDLDATVTTQDHTGALVQKPRIAWSTWGRERGSNDFAYVENVILVGVLTRDEAEMRSALHAAARDLEAPIETTDVKASILSADAVVVQQALARGAIRQTWHGVCGRMRAWLFHRDVDALKSELDRVFPNARWLPWQTAYLRSRQAKESDVAKTLREYLTELATNVRQVNIPAMRRTLCLLATDGIPDRTFARAREAALQHPDVARQWQHDGGRLIIRKEV
jgi:hypothetical protein